MALLVPGQTHCMICGLIIEKEDPTVMFPAFLKNTHPLARYSEGIFHEHCFNASPDKAAVEHLYSKFREIWANRPTHLKTKEEIDAWGQSAFSEFD
jgi:hypothetical protein